MQLFIPTIGTHLCLTDDWTFKLHQESRNFAVRQALLGADTIIPADCWYHPEKYARGSEPLDMTLPAGTIITVDRIYIRKAIGDFDSVTFFIKNCPDPRFASKKNKGTFKGSARFWAKLDDVNNIFCDVLDPA